MQLMLFLSVVISMLTACREDNSLPVSPHLSDTSSLMIQGVDEIRATEYPQNTSITVPRNIPVNDYFCFMDSLVAFYTTLLPYPFNEYTLAHTNPWIIDTLKSFDYYEKKKKGILVSDQRSLIVLHRGDTLFLPDSVQAARIENRLNNTVIDVNIPEYRLRIWVCDTVLYSFPVRVGRNERKYLKTAGREVSLRTPIGEGTIVRIARDPYFVNPVDGRPYSSTRRDDGTYTHMPQIPWLEPMINGERQGALIHPTTNPATLGKAYSNGCVGTGEGDAWIVYYYAPIGTSVRFRYDLGILNAQGDTCYLQDIYKLHIP